MSRAPTLDRSQFPIIFTEAYLSAWIVIACLAFNKSEENRALQNTFTNIQPSLEFVDKINKLKYEVTRAKDTEIISIRPEGAMKVLRLNVSLFVSRYDKSGEKKRENSNRNISTFLLVRSSYDKMDSNDKNCSIKIVSLFSSPIKKKL